MTPALAVLTGLLAGVLAGLLHTGLLWYAVHSAVTRRSALPLLLGAPVRMALVAALLAGAATLGGGPGAAGGLVGWLLSSHLARRRVVFGQEGAP